MVIRKHITVLSYSLLLLAQILFAVTVIARPAQAQTPVGYWKFDDGSGTQAIDSSGFGHTAILVMALAGSREKSATLCLRMPDNSSMSAFQRLI